MATGYDRIYTDLLPQLAACDIAAQAAHLGLRADDDGSVPVAFLGRPYRITNHGVAVEDGAPADVNNCSILIHYIISEGRIEPRHNFVPLDRLTGMIEGRNAQEGWFISNSLLRETESRYAPFAAAAAKLGGTHAGKVGGGECWQFDVLPKMPVQLIFFEADEEFPAELQFRFDETAPYYMGFECLAFLSGSVIHALSVLAKEQKHD